MAGSKVTRRSVASEIATILDSPEVAALVAELDALRWTGRKGYGARTMLGACLVEGALRAADVDARCGPDRGASRP